MVLVCANGDVQPGRWFQALVEQASILIAADGGIRHFVAQNASPDILVGDLDSAPEEMIIGLVDQGTEVISFPKEKDETDLELALLHAVALVDEKICVAGALGGRLDQTLANILLLAHPALTERNVQLVTEFQRAWLIKGCGHIVGKSGDSISLIPIGGDARIRCTHNLQWQLTDELLQFGPARGVSNVMTADEATVEVRSGQLLCVHTSQQWQR